MKKLLELCLKWRLLVFVFVVIVAALGATRNNFPSTPFQTSRTCKCKYSRTCPP
jgi:hypothetical protein